MIPLTSEQKQLLFDYCVGTASPQQCQQAQELIESHQQAATVNRQIRRSLYPLDSCQAEPCPDSLVESTIARLNQSANQSRIRLQELIADEQKISSKTRKERPFWGNFVEMVATAAVIMFVAGVLIPSLQFARRESWKQQSQMQLGRIFQGLYQYTQDHDGSLPQVAMSAGQPWWQIGSNSDQNVSNTRNVWLLVREGYVDATNFVCPARSQGQALQFDPDQADQYRDFPARRYISYSFRIPCPEEGFNIDQLKVLIADLNPLFESLPQDYSKQLEIRLTDQLRKMNSLNHGGRGQNVLRANGSVVFETSRMVGDDGTDIYTIKDTEVYRGREYPACTSDAFLAP